VRYGPALFLLAAARIDHGQNFVLAHDEVFLAVELDLLPGLLAEEDEVSSLDIERNAPAVVLDLAVANGDDFALLRLFLCGIRDDDSADFLFPFLDALNEDAVV
jgi:hypothetical protein